MKSSIDRREFMKRSVAAGVAAMTGSLSLPSRIFGKSLPSKLDLSVINGTNYFASTMKAVEMLGGMSKFVTKGSSVGLLINSPWNKPGTYTNPVISLAVLKMCIDAGAGKVYSIENASLGYWKRSSNYDKYKNEIKFVQSNSEKKTVPIKNGKLLKEAEISKIFLDCDVLVNIPIVKNHQGTNFTCSLKNVMGACSHQTNGYFHQGGGGTGYYDTPDFLSQCIADLQLVRTPNLCIVDASEFVLTNGPAGPGELRKSNKVVAGTNCVSVDAYCSTLLDFKPADISMIRFANQHGLGEMNLAKISIKEV
ncbi:MAG: DUF362 domain-containing protein [Ignavibacteriales bacterium]|nr:DUF362 domain-containing protein [Ignavibacteriales bacterium]